MFVRIIHMYSSYLAMILNSLLGIKDNHCKKSHALKYSKIVSDHIVCRIRNKCWHNEDWTVKYFLCLNFFGRCKYFVKMIQNEFCRKSKISEIPHVKIFRLISKLISLRSSRFAYHYNISFFQG